MPDILNFLKNNYKSISDVLSGFNYIKVRNKSSDYLKDIVELNSSDDVFAYDKNKVKKPNQTNTFGYNEQNMPGGKLKGLYNYDKDDLEFLMMNPQYHTLRTDYLANKDKYLNFYDYASQKGITQQIKDKQGNVLTPRYYSLDDIYSNSYNASNLELRSSKEPMTYDEKLALIDRINKRISEKNYKLAQIGNTAYYDLIQHGKTGDTYANYISNYINSYMSPYADAPKQKSEFKYYTVGNKIVRYDYGTKDFNVVYDGTNPQYDRPLNANQVFFENVDGNDKAYYYEFNPNEKSFTKIEIPDLQKPPEKDYHYGNSGFKGFGNSFYVPPQFYQDLNEARTYFNQYNSLTPQLQSKFDAWSSWIWDQVRLGKITEQEAQRLWYENTVNQNK